VNDVQEREVAWYRRHGRHPERVVRDGHGREYVIGDWSWERSHGPGAEMVEPKACGDCRRVKPPEDFYVKQSGGLTWACKVCSRARASKWQREHPKRLRLVS
jgi:hypothetical protein